MGLGALPGNVFDVKAPTRPLLAFIACAAIWGSTFLAIRVGNDALPALWACTLRYAVAAVILIGLMLAARVPWPKGPALDAALRYGFWEFGLSIPLLYWGERVVPSGLAAVVYAVCPIVAMLSAKLLGMESLTAPRLGAAILAFLGVAIVFWQEILQGGSSAGLAAVLLAACTGPIGGLMLQRGPRQSAVAANAVGVLVGLPFSLFASLILGERQVLPTTLRELIPVLYLAIAGSVGAFVIFAWLVLRWRATTVAFLGVIVPVIAVVLGAAARGEGLAPGSLAGAAIVIAAVVAVLSWEQRQA